MATRPPCHDTPDVTGAFKAALDKLAEKPDVDPADVLFKLNSS